MSKPEKRSSNVYQDNTAKKKFVPFIIPQDDYPVWLTRERVMGFIYSLPKDPWWNALFCIYVLTLVTLGCCIQLHPSPPPISADIEKFVIIIITEIPYIFHVSILICNDYHSIHLGESRSLYQCGYILDVVSLIVPFVTAIVLGITTTSQLIDLAAITLRMHRPFRYLGSLNYYLKGSIIGTLFKYIYISISMRVFYAFVFYYTKQAQDLKYENPVGWIKTISIRNTFRSFYQINKIFIPMGPDYYPTDTLSRMLYIVIMLSGVLLVLGIAIASLSLIIGLYLRPEEEFRARFRLIMDDMINTNLPYELRKKVKTFYRMFWHKQKAVYETRLLPIYPHCLGGAIRTNIYFKAMQKSQVIRDLSSPLLSQIAARMETVHYIPGDFIIKRNSDKTAMIFINNGDVELLSAEDDETALLRFTRGTILNPCGAQFTGTRSYVAIGAATFCTAHVLKTTDLWLVVSKYGLKGQSFMLRSAVNQHLGRVKRHFIKKDRPKFKYKSNIVSLKRTLMTLKEARDDNGQLLLERADMLINIAGCYVMRNQSDMSSTGESDAICWRTTFPCILQPDTSLLFAWTYFIAVLTVIVTFVHPYYLIYLNDVPIGFKFFDFMVTLIYILDIIVNLSTGTQIEEGVPMTFMQTSSEQMKSCWFVINVISVLPIFNLIGDGFYAGLNKLAKIPQIFRTLMYLEELCVFHSKVLRFFSFLLLIIIMTYLVAALQQFFTCASFGYCLLKNFTSPPYWEKKPLDNGPLYGRVSYSLYYAISMIAFTSHKTALFARTLWQYQLFVIILLEVCSIVRLLIEGSYSATIMVTESLRDQYKTCIETVKTFLVKINMDPVLRHRFINYLQLCWYTDKAYAITQEKNSILFDLPSHVNEDILTRQRSKYFLIIPFMKFLPTDVLKKISAQARIFYTAPYEILLNTGDITNEIYVIKEGVCEVIDPETKNVVRLLSAKGYFGDVECLLRLPAYFTVRAASHVRLYSISRKIFEKFILTPKIKDAINYAKKLPEYNALLTARKPFLKYEIPPRPPNREHFPLLRKHEIDFAFLHPFYKFGCLSILRYVFPRYTFRPDGLYLKRCEWFRAVCALASANIYPLYTVLQLQYPWLWHVTVVLDISAYFDIIQRMLVGYFKPNGILIYHPTETLIHYLKGAFIVDLLACLPLEFLDYVRTTIYFEDNAYKIPHTYSYLMYNRMLQLYRVPNTLEILDEFIDRQDIILIIKAIPVLLGLIIIVTSLMLESSVTKWRTVNGGWRLNIIRDPTHGNWIENNGDAVRYNITETPWNAVLTTFYWVVYEITSTGFNLFQPHALNMIVVLTAGMLLGLVTTTYYTVRVISIRANVDQALGRFQEHMKDIITFMKREKMSNTLRRVVVSHYEHQWEKVGGTDNSRILKLCYQITLRTDVILHIYGRTFTKCPIIPNDISLLRNVGRAVKSTYMRKTMTVVERDDVISEMYVVDRGFVEMHCNHNGDHNNIVYLSRGSVFGNLDNLKTVVCPTKFVTGSNVHLLEINADKFHIIIKDFPAVKELLVKYRPNYENYIVSDQSFQPDQPVKAIIIHPSNKTPVLNFVKRHRKGLQMYSIIICLLSLYGDPYNAAFQDNRIPLIASLYTLDVCFFLTILLKLLMPYLAKKDTGTWNELRSKRQQYLQKNFRYEVMSCIPIEVLSLANRSPLTIFGFLRLNRCLRLITLNENLTQYHKNLSINLTVTTVATVAIYFILFVHTMTCIWYYLSIIEDIRQPFSSWRYKVKGENKTVCEAHYMCALYFILTTFTLNGVGDILPRKQSEIIFVCILMILSTIIFMIYLGEFSNIIQYRSFRYYAFYSKYLELLAFLKNNRVSQNLIKVTKNYTIHLWQEGRGRQVPYFLMTAPKCLRLNIMSAAYMHHLTSHPVLNRCEPSFLRQLVGHFNFFYYSEHLFVVKEGQITNSVYFVHKGRVEEFDENLRIKREVYKAGQYFGSVNGLNLDIPYDISYRTIIKSQVLTLCFDEWKYLLKHFPKSKSIIDGDNAQRSDRVSPDKNLKKQLNIDRKLTIHHIPLEKFMWPTENRTYDNNTDSHDESKFGESVPTSTHLEENYLNQWSMKSKHSTAAGSTSPEAPIDLLKTKEKDNNITKLVDLGKSSEITTDEDVSKTKEIKPSVSGSQTSKKVEESAVNQLPMDIRRSTAAGSTVLENEIDKITPPVEKDKMKPSELPITEEVDMSQAKPHLPYNAIQINDSLDSRDKVVTEHTEQKYLELIPASSTSSQIDKRVSSRQTRDSSLSKELRSTIPDILLAEEKHEINKEIVAKPTEQALSESLEKLPLITKENLKQLISPESLTQVKTQAELLDTHSRQDRVAYVSEMQPTTSKDFTDIKHLESPENQTLEKTQAKLLATHSRQDRVASVSEMQLTTSKDFTDLKHLESPENLTLVKTREESVTPTTTLSIDKTNSTTVPLITSPDTIVSDKIERRSIDGSVTVSLEKYMMSKIIGDPTTEKPSENTEEASPEIRESSINDSVSVEEYMMSKIVGDSTTQKQSENTEEASSETSGSVSPSSPADKKRKKSK